MLYIAIALFLPLLFYVVRARRKTFPFPPGPKKLPIVGNLFHMPKKGFVWLEYAEMCRRYDSDIIHLSALGNSIVVLNSARAVNDLLEKRSSMYSSRPSTTMLGELMGWESGFALRPNDDIWKAQRKIVTQAMPPTDPKRFHSKQLSGTHDLLRALPQSDDVMKSLQTWAAKFIMDITYGIQGDEAKLYLCTAIETLNSIAVAATPGAFYVDQITILKYIPEWFPGASFKQKAREWNKLRVKLIDDPYLVTKARLAAGTATPSLTSLALEEIDHTQDVAHQEEIIKLASVTAYGGGSDTTVAYLGGFIIAMLMNPEVQTKAHRELEKVLGPGDLPSFSDEPTLSYITAIVREVIRYNPVVPLAIPHLLTQDNIYKGYFLPKGSIIMPNVWSILHNEEDYPKPELFNPSRFLDAEWKLNPNVKDPATAAFGFGRRACPGKHIAIASLWITVASILACYTIEPELDENGKPIKPKGEWYSGPTLFNHPLPFKCRFIPRSRDMEASLGVSLS
ncbi:cytochrome P450 [Gymnopus androsaceus JB14]|uniref:Cytochrome P450 n=1 Tax=Gymnopus androsaceus JB14 TaxID=1447944 RepID=A0A6A4GKB2_9AGAR|nr:cytochrome P450 [Gymnopus androsaceus JB14]